MVEKREGVNNFSFGGMNKIVGSSKKDESKRVDKEGNFVSKLYSQCRDNFSFNPGETE